MQYGLMTYDIKKHFNVGDYIQSVAARQFLPRVDQYVNRERLSEYDGPQIKLLMNGWFMHHPRHWPPSSKVTPLFVSLHLTKRAAATLLDEKGIAYLKQYRIGARDMFTLKVLQEKGIDTYFSSCLTLTLGRSYTHQPGTDVYFVDVLHKWHFIGRRRRLLRKVFSDKLLDSAIHIQHRQSASDYPTEESRFELADRYLTLYQNARLVVTSRLHCALPCLAMGTPVIFVDGWVRSKERIRFEGARAMLNTVEFAGSEIHANFDDPDHIRNQDRHLEYVGALEQRCREFVQS